MLFERDNCILWNATRYANIEKMQNDFVDACRRGDVTELYNTFSNLDGTLLTEDIISTGAIMATRNDQLEVLIFMFKSTNFKENLDKNDLLGVAVSYNSKNCFAFLIVNLQVSIDYLKGSNLYDKALNMQKDLSFHHQDRTKVGLSLES